MFHSIPALLALLLCSLGWLQAQSKVKPLPDEPFVGEWILYTGVYEPESGSLEEAIRAARPRAEAQARLMDLKLKWNGHGWFTIPGRLATDYGWQEGVEWMFNEDGSMLLLLHTFRKQVLPLKPLSSDSQFVVYELPRISTAKRKEIFILERIPQNRVKKPDAQPMSVY